MDELVSLAEYLSKAPTDEETARRAVAPYLALTAEERWAAFGALLREMDQLLGGREPAREDGEAPFWRHWIDPALGRPR